MYILFIILIIVLLIMLKQYFNLKEELKTIQSEKFNEVYEDQINRIKARANQDTERIRENFNQICKETEKANNHLVSIQKEISEKINFNENLKKSGSSLRDYQVALNSMGIQGQQAFSQLASSILQAEVPLKRTSGLMTSLATAFKNTIKWQLSSSVMHGFMSSVSSAFNYAESLNKSLTDIRIVTNKSAEEIAQSHYSLAALLVDIGNLHKCIEENNWFALCELASGYSGNNSVQYRPEDFDIFWWSDQEESVLLNVYMAEQRVAMGRQDAQDIPDDERTNVVEAPPIKENKQDPIQEQSLTLKQSYHTKIVGITFTNDDGSDRQRIVRDLFRANALNIGQELKLNHEPTNRFDKNCIQVLTMDGKQLGCLSKELAATVAPDMARGRIYKAFVASINGGSIGCSYGINIRIEVYEPATKTTADTPKKTRPHREYYGYDMSDIDDINSVARGYGYSIDDDGHWVES